MAQTSELYTMKQACEACNLSYETLKFYCNEGLVPNVKRSSNNRRVFDQHDINWINNLGCLRRCGMSISEMRQYIALCLEGEPSIPVRKEMLAAKQERLREQIKELQASIEYIDWKQGFYDDVLSGKIAYHSDLIPDDQDEQRKTA